MNERLTIEVLSPYLPYGLKVIFDGKVIGVLSGIKPSLLTEVIVLEEMDNNTPIYRNWNLFDTKPILRPLSDLTKEQHIVLGRLLTNTPDKHEAFARADSEAWLRNGMQPVMSLNTCLSVTQYLFSIHADVFGLIDKGLAIDINTLTK